jgi:hypothetical protein
MSVGPNPDVDARETSEPSDSSGSDLCTVVVKYEQGPDRRTVYPRDADEFERMTHWFTANDDAFCRLDEHR